MAYLLIVKDDYYHLVDLLVESYMVLSKSDRVYLLENAALGSFLGSVSLDLPARDYAAALVWELRAAGPTDGRREPVLAPFLRAVRAHIQGHPEHVAFVDRLLAQPLAERYEGSTRSPYAASLRSRAEAREERNVPAVVAIDLRTVTRTDLVAHPLARVLPGGEPPQPVAPDTPLLTLFEALHSAVLITGAPGAGKTMTLLSLARALIERAEQIPGAPIPVVFNLSSWGPSKRPRLDWLADEISKFPFPRHLGRAWLAGRDILPLLDGLDEVAEAARPDCVRASNAYMSTVGVPGIVVCCRLDAYEQLKTPLALGGALQILPLTPQDADGFLARRGRPTETLRAALSVDPLLSELAASPLMLHVVSAVYANAVPQALATDARQPEESRVASLWDRYIENMFRREGRTQLQRFTPAYMVDHLAWLARRMRQHSQSLFQIEGLQPIWLETLSGRWGYALASRLGVTLIILTVGVLALDGGGPWFSASLSILDRLVRAGLLALLAGSVLGVAAALRFTWASTDEQAYRPQRTGFRTLRSFIGASLSAGVPLTALYIITRFFDFYQQDGVYGLLLTLLSGLVTAAICVVLKGVPFGLTVGLRTHGADPRSDIQVVEALRVSGFAAVKGVLMGLATGLLSSAGASPPRHPPAELPGVTPRRSLWYGIKMALCNSGTASLTRFLPQ